MSENFYKDFIEGNFTIIDRYGREVPYVLWKQQEDMLNWMLQERQRSAVVLKAASLGSSSLWLGVGMVDCLTLDNQVMCLVTHDEKLAEFLLRRAKGYVNKIMQKANNLSIKRESKEYIELSNGSLVYICSARSTSDIGLGNPINILICSECAFYPDAGKLIRNLNPRARHGTRIYESTAYGAGGWFYATCKRAFAGSSVYRGFFVPWFHHWEYTKGSGIVLKDKTETELELQEEHHITDGQLLWRRETIEELEDDAERSGGLSGEDAFRQNYPSYWEESFIMTGSPVFGHKIYDKVRKTIQEPDFVGEIMYAG